MSSAKKVSDIKLILFDLDGTLVNTLLEIADAVNDTLPPIYGGGVIENALVQTWIGNGAATLFKRALTHCGIVNADLQTEFEASWPLFQKAYAQRCGTNSPPYHGVMDCLSALQKSGYRLAVLTNKEGHFAHQVIEKNGMANFFEAVTAGDTFDCKKPDPRVMHLTLEQLTLSASEVLFIGDSMIDIKTGVLAGIKTWAVSYGYNHGAFDIPEAAGYQPERFIKDFHQLKKLLLSSDKV